MYKILERWVSDGFVIKKEKERKLPGGDKFEYTLTEDALQYLKKLKQEWNNHL